MLFMPIGVNGFIGEKKSIKKALESITKGDRGILASQTIAKGKLERICSLQRIIICLDVDLLDVTVTPKMKHFECQKLHSR